MVSTFPLPQFYNMPIVLIPTAAVVALSELTTQMDFGGGDGWAMSQDYAMHVLPRYCPMSCHSAPRTADAWWAYARAWLAADLSRG